MLYETFEFEVKSYYKLINILCLHEAFKSKRSRFINKQTFYAYKKFLKLKTKSFCEIVAILCLYEAFKLETTSFYESISLLRFKKL